MEEKYIKRLAEYKKHATKEDYERVEQITMCIDPMFEEDISGAELRKELMMDGYLYGVEGWKFVAWKGVYELLDAKILIRE